MSKDIADVLGKPFDNEADVDTKISFRLLSSIFVQMKANDDESHNLVKT